MINKMLNIAGINISIDTTHIVGELIAKELGAIERSEQDVDISIDFNNTNLDYEVTSGNNCKFNEKEFFYKSLYPVKYKVINLFNDNKMEINIAFMSKSIKAKIQSFLYGKNTIKKNTILSYGLFWYILQLELLKKKKTFLHAGIFSKDGESIAITGTGGSGKTSSLFKVLENKDYKYLAEDFGIIGDDGYTYYNPKALSIYETDILFNPKILNKTYEFLSFKEKLLWDLQVKLLHHNPIIKVNPQKLLDRQIVLKSKLKKVLYYVRVDIDEINVSSISKEDLAERSLNVALREFKMFFEIFTLLNANKKSEYKFLTIDDIIQSIRNLYIDIFSKTENYLVEIPFNETPDNIVKVLKDKGIIS
jgi:hypothetical protein